MRHDRSRDQTLRRLQLEEFERGVELFIEHFFWPRARVLAERQRRLRWLLMLAKEKSPWHRKRLAHIDPTRFTEAGISRLPVMAKDDLMTHFDEIITDKRLSLETIERHLSDLHEDAYLLDNFHAVSSGGSSGVRGVFVYDWQGWITFGLSTARPIMLMKKYSPANKPDSIVALVADHASHASTAFVQSFEPWIRRQFDTFLTVPVTLPFTDIVARLNKIRPKRLSGFPSLLRGLCDAAEKGELHIEPVSILSGAEPLFPDIREALTRNFGAAIYNFYGCSEASNLAFSCPKGAGLHLSDDLVIVEPVDINGRRAAPGNASAKIYVTNLFNTLLPLIRYELNDVVTPLATQGRCACGSFFDKIADVQGRTEDAFLYEGGVFVHPVAFSPLARDPAIIDYQIQQTARGARIFVRAQDAFDQERIRTSVASRLQDLGLVDPQISITLVEHIERSPTGKLLRFVPLRPISQLPEIN